MRWDEEYDKLTLEEALQQDAELRQMQQLLAEMADNYATEYDHYDDVKKRVNEISDELLFEILDEYLNESHLNDNDDEVLNNLETDNDPVHLQVINEVQNGIPMQVDEIPESATPMTSNPTRTGRGRKPKVTKKRKANTSNERRPSNNRAPPIVDHNDDKENMNCAISNAKLTRKYVLHYISANCHFKNYVVFFVHI